MSNTIVATQSKAGIIDLTRKEGTPVDNAAPETPSQQADLEFKRICERKQRYLRTAEAKREYFLTSNDMHRIPHEKPGGWGSGRTKLYRTDDLLRYALQKHGVSALKKKMKSRLKRVANKKRKEQQARVCATIENIRAFPSYTRNYPRLRLPEDFSSIIAQNPIHPAYSLNFTEIFGVPSYYSAEMQLSYSSSSCLMSS
eukprot:jgi/Bigna1/146639/aug1.118_g21347